MPAPPPPPQLQTLPKNSIRDRYKPISKNTKTLDPLLYTTVYNENVPQK